MADIPKIKGVKKIVAKEIIPLTRQLASMIGAGMPILSTMQTLEEQCDNPEFKKILTHIRATIEGGEPMSRALSAFPKVFDDLYVNMAKAGEAAGSLETSLNRLAEFLEKAQKIKSKVKSAMTYPIVVLVVAITMAGGLMVTVIPKFEKLFEDMLGKGAKLPPLTQFVVNLAHNFMDYSLPIAGAIFLLVMLVRMINKTKGGHYFFDAVKLRLPGFGPLIRKSSIGRTTRTLGTLMQSGVPVLQALDIVRDTAGNAIIAKAYQNIHEAVKEGDNMTPAMEASKQFPPMVVSMVDVGEETGALPEMLNRVANTYDGEVYDAVDAMTSIIEPLMIVCLAVIVGTLVIAMFQPLMSIIGTMSGG